jgi:hypothetical protein
MYQAKENERQRYRFFEPAMNARAAERQSTEGDGADNSGVAAGPETAFFTPALCRT